MKKGSKKKLVVDGRIYSVRGRGNGCRRLKVLQVPEKNALSPMNVYEEWKEYVYESWNIEVTKCPKRKQNMEFSCIMNEDLSLSCAWDAWFPGG